MKASELDIYEMLVNKEQLLQFISMQFYFFRMYGLIMLIFKKFFFVCVQTVWVFVIMFFKLTIKRVFFIFVLTS